MSGLITGTLNHFLIKPNQVNFPNPTHIYLQVKVYQPQLKCILIRVSEKGHKEKALFGIAESFKHFKCISK